MTRYRQGYNDNGYQITIMPSTIRPTMRQVAEHAGVSQVTVTNVLRGRAARTSPATRDRVLRSVRELGYTPVAQPSSQKYHIETRVIGITFDQVTLGQDYLAMHAYLGLSEAATWHGYDLLMMHRALPDWAPDREEVQFLDRRSDGFIFVAPVNRHRVLETLVDNKIPVVVCCGADAPDGAGWVINDEMQNMRLALDYLWKCGHRRVAYLEKSGHDKSLPSRGDHFEMAARERGSGLEVRRFGLQGVLNAWRVERADLRAIREWGATAVLCFNDHLAFCLWDVAESEGLVVPRDLSIIGVDDFPEAAARGLTTVRNDFRAQARGAVDSWVELARGGDYRQHRHVIAGTLIERTSVSALR